MCIGENQLSQLADIEIAGLCNPRTGNGLIEPFIDSQVKLIAKHSRMGTPPAYDKVISFGVSSYGYDFRLSDRNFKIFSNIRGLTIDPKKFDVSLLVDAEAKHDASGTYFIIPGNSYALGETVEKVNMPRDLTAIGIGKSTYARCGLIVNVTPLEAGWSGIITLELANVTPSPMRVYANEGICQFVFFRSGIWPKVTYADREGKYMGQTELTVAKV